MFILITPAHNELDQVAGLVQCIRSSSLQPDLWLIIDDNSDDGTGNEFKKIGSDLDFIRIHRIKKSDNYMEFHISEILQAGLKSIQKEILHADFIGILDADIRFGPKYWSHLTNFIIKNPDWGIVSGVLCSPDESGKLFIEPFQRTDNPRGGLRLINGKCFHQISKVERSRAWDSIMNVKCRLLGWKICTLQNIFAESIRPTSDRYNEKSGAISLGQRAWHLHQPFWQVIIRSIAWGLKGKFIKGIYYYIGFLQGWCKNEEQFPDREIRNYYRYTRTYEWIKMIGTKIQKKPGCANTIPVKEISPKEILN